ncbi:MAG: hypothetical protein R3F19_06905 [Verrucomicrobiales bacterium]
MSSYWLRTTVGLSVRGAAALLLVLTVGNSGNVTAELISSGTVNLSPGYFSGSPLDINSDGVSDYSFGATFIGTADEPRSLSAQTSSIETLRSNVLMGDDLGGIPHSGIDWSLPVLLPNGTYWQSGHTTLHETYTSLVRNTDPPEYVTSVSSGRWSNKSEAYLLGAFEAADGYHAVWFKITFQTNSITPEGEVILLAFWGGLRIEEWTYDSEPFTIRPVDALPRIALIRSFDRDTLKLTRLIAGHQYIIEYSDDSTLVNWAPIESTITARFSADTPTLPRRDSALPTRFYRVRHQWISSFPQ